MGCDLRQHLVHESSVDFECVSRSSYTHWEGIWSQFVCDRVGY